MTSYFEYGEYRDVCDPRDEMLGWFTDVDSQPISVGETIYGFMSMDAGLEQLVAAELLNCGFLVEIEGDALRLTETGRSFVAGRLEKWPSWVDYAIKPNASELPPLSSRLRVAYAAYVHRPSGTQPWPRDKRWRELKKVENL